MAALRGGTRLRALTIVAVALAAALPVTASQAQDIPWNRIRDARKLDATQREAAAEALRSAPCYGGCEGTVLECLRAGDPFGVRLANFIARRAGSGHSVESILASVEKRKLSAFPPKKCEPDLSGLIPSGNPDAPVRVVVYADFECPVCRAAVTALRELSVAMPDTISLWFKNYPLSQDPRSIPAALAYLAADRQGLGWEMLEYIFAQTGALTDDVLEASAVAAGVDVDQYRLDLKSAELLDRIKAEKLEGHGFGVDTTPGVLVNGKLYLGAKTKVELLDRIEEELDLISRETGSGAQPR